MADQPKDSKAKHTAGGVTTRDDALDSGVPMLPGDPSEPVGPEDALGSGPKRGDYSKVIGNLSHSAAVPVERKPGDTSSAGTVLVDQNKLVSQRGDEKGVKGGTHPLADEAK